MARLVVEAPRKILDAPRTLLLEAFCGWLEEQPEFASLPDSEIVVSISPHVLLPPRYAGRRSQAVGCFAATVSGRLNPRWEVVIAYGEACSRYFASSSLPDLEAWLVTLPHELLHLAQFAKAYHSLAPLLAGHVAVITQADNEDDIEDQARAIASRFCTIHRDLLEDPNLLLSISDAVALGPVTTLGL